MRLTRNTTPDGKCKYAIVRLDKLRKMPQKSLITESAAKALDELAALGFLEYGQPGTEEEFFVIKLKDRFAAKALFAYAKDAGSDLEYSREVRALAVRAMEHPYSKRPD